MLDAFVPMRTWLVQSREPVAAVPEPVVELEPEPERIVECSYADDAIAEVKRFRAALADVLESCVGEILTDIAGDVLARELQLAPCDVHAITQRAIARYGVDPVRVRVHPDDAQAFTFSDLPIVADASLRRGDALIEARHGSIDASLGVRLERLLGRFPA